MELVFQAEDGKCRVPALRMGSMSPRSRRIVEPCPGAVMALGKSQEGRRGHGKTLKILFEIQRVLWKAKHWLF